MEKIALHVVEEILSRLRGADTPEERLMWLRWLEGSLEMAYELGCVSRFQQESFTLNAFDIVQRGFDL